MKSAVYKKIGNIAFGFLSPKVIQKNAAVKIVTPELYDREGYPVDGGLMDIHLGVIDPGLRCKTCGGHIKECPGHFGYLELARPAVHIKFIKHILNFLKFTCRDCGRVMISDRSLARHRNTFIEIGKREGIAKATAKIKETISRQRNTKKCPHCQAKQGTVKIDKPYSFYEDDIRINAIEVRNRLEKIPDDDIELFGIDPKVARPEWMILTLIPVPPVTLRPSITLESGDRSEDDLTHKLGDIVRINQRLFENINAGAPEIIIEDLWDLLQYHITTYFDNNIAQIPPARHRGGQPLKTLSSRIKSKEGRIRHNLAGKRTNFSARTVISPDPNLNPNEVGVPMDMAMKLTIPEKVTEWNLEHMKKYVENGQNDYPGSNYVIRPDGRKKRITDETKEEILEEIEPGYRVERHLINGDIALFNRQPSLHRMSMMAHKIRVLPGKTLRMNPAVCNPYNADFDGDEMNLHIPQTEEARAEAETLMLVQTQLIAPREGAAIIGCKQDAITGNYLLTLDDTELDKEDAIDILYSVGIDNIPKSIYGKDKVKGKDIFSVIIPSEFNYHEKSKDGGDVVIENGKLKSGVIDEKAIGEGKGLLLRKIHKRYGDEAAVNFIERLFKLGIKTLLRHGFTVGIADIDIPEETANKINATIKEIEKEVDLLLGAHIRGEIKPLPGRSIKETIELKILELLNRARNKCGDEVLKNAPDESSVVFMNKCGSRGNIFQFTQVTALVGQQALRGGRINNGFKNRTLSYFKENDISPDARGFIKSSFREGLKPHEVFFASMTGRDSLMDTALRTPKSGYLYRRLSNALQDIKVEHDRTVRDISGKIIQFAYGEDEMDVSKSEGGKVNVNRIIKEVGEEGGFKK